MKKLLCSVFSTVFAFSLFSAQATQATTISEIPAQQLTQQIISTDTDETEKLLFIQMLGSNENYHADIAPLKPILFDENSSANIKTTLLSIADFSSVESISLLKEVFENSDNTVAFRALIELWQEHPQEALLEAVNILKETSGFTDSEKTRAAITIIGAAARGGVLQFTTEEESWFIQNCKQLLNTTSNNMMKDTLVLALSDLGSFEALDVVVTSPVVENSFKNDVVVENINNLTLSEQNDLKSQVVQPYAANADYAYAVYRDGAVGGIDWHTGLVNGSTTSSSTYIIHAPGIAKRTGYTNFSGFKDGKNFKGYYKPKYSMSDSKKSSVMNTAKRIATLAIPYTGLGQMGYSVMNTGRTIQPEDIATIRCDGVVEYSYEYNGIRIGGGNSDWNVSIDKDANFNAHSGATITPEKQAANYMTFVHQ